MRVLVTGGRGFIGSFLVEELRAKGFQVYCLLRHKKVTEDWLTGLDIKPLEGDILDPRSLGAAVRNMDYVFHLAGLTKAVSREQFYQVNVQGTTNMLDAVVKDNRPLKRFVLVSSLAAAGPSPDGKPLNESHPVHPVSDYGASKLQAEQAALAYAPDIPISIVRPPAVFGPRDRDVFTFFKYARQGWWPKMSGGPRFASLIYVKDLAGGLLQVAQSQAAVGQTFFLCNDDFYSWDDIADLMAQFFATRVRTIPIPISLGFLAAAVSEMFGKIVGKAALMNLDKFRELKATHWICDNSKAKKECGFRIEHELNVALAETVAWYQANGWL
ncbi:MAG TPA: NAD-dependent epimerase/dehydratase family protein [bacterium]